MLQEAIDLQQNAIAELVRKMTKTEVTFRAPTGSGKTRMMADFMNQIIQTYPNTVFLVSTLSKGNLAEQNYNAFKDCVDKNIFPNLNPHLITSESSGEERLFIPVGYNVYVLPRDLYKDKSKLKDEGTLVNFLDTLTFNSPFRKSVWLIKDECHQATNNLDGLSSYFDKIINFSATPNLKRGQNPDVEITDEAAMNAKLIKNIEWGDEKDTVETAICKFEEIRENYVNLLGVNPCLIIQISNKDKADDEWANIERILEQKEHLHLKWMSVVDKKDKCRTNDKVSKLPVERWKDYAKENGSTIDVIVFKMVISEGWDIPRACMLYQVRDTKSKQLDEQVMGRVRRNPRLVDFEKLSPEAQNLATTAWIWGIEPQCMKKSRQVKLFGGEFGIPQAIKIKPTHLKPLTERKDFKIEKFLEIKSKSDVTHTSIFTLYAKLQRCENEIRDLCYNYADTVQNWWQFCEHIDAVRKEYNNYICNYADSMEIVKDADGKEKEVSFPVSSTYIDNEHYQNINDWVWRRKDGSDKFSFDSEAEREWASILKDVSLRGETEFTEVGDLNPLYGQMKTDNTPEPKRLNAENKYLWGKNFLPNSEIKFEYYQNGIHSSYPDFVLKDKKGRIHLFEVKSVNMSNAAQFDSDEYKGKILALIECYKQCSKLTNYNFYLPVLKEEVWQITKISNGNEETITKEKFLDSFK
ncbi:MAG: DEAD/DEAH box helicase family protein [Bacteroidales bacterium]|nr:DEAD/DEAH box helicase family protein [Bacteroidales bacterium]